MLSCTCKHGFKLYFHPLLDIFRLAPTGSKQRAPVGFVALLSLLLRTKQSQIRNIRLSRSLAYRHSTCVVRNFILHVAEKHDPPTSESSESSESNRPVTFFQLRGRPRSPEVARVAPRNCSHPWCLGPCQDCPTSSTPGRVLALLGIPCITYLVTWESV